MADAFADRTRGVGDPPVKHEALAADTEPAHRPQCVYCEAAGTITLRDEDGTELPYAMTAGQILPFRAVFVGSITGGTFYGWS